MTTPPTREAASLMADASPRSVSSTAASTPRSAASTATPIPRPHSSAPGRIACAYGSPARAVDSHRSPGHDEDPDGHRPAGPDPRDQRRRPAATTSRNTTDSGINAAPGRGGAVAEPQLALQDDQVARGGERAVEQQGRGVDRVELPRAEQRRRSIGCAPPPLDRHQRGQAHDADDAGRTTGRFPARRRARGQGVDDAARGRPPRAGRRRRRATAAGARRSTRVRGGAPSSAASDERQVEQEHVAPRAWSTSHPPRVRPDRRAECGEAGPDPDATRPVDADAASPLSIARLLGTTSAPPTPWTSRAAIASAAFGAAAQHSAAASMTSSPTIRIRRRPKWSASAPATNSRAATVTR